MNLMFYAFNKPVAPDRLDAEVRQSSIETALHNVEVEGDIVKVWFKASLSSADYTLLQQIIADHVATPLVTHEPIFTKMLEEPTYATDIDRTYQMQSFCIHVEASDPYVPSVVSFPFPIVLLGGDCHVRPDMVGDACMFEMAPGMIVGAMIQDGVQGSNTIMLNDEAIDYYVFRGFAFRILDGLGEIDCGRVISKAGREITIENPLPRNVLAGAYVKCWHKAIPFYRFSNSPAIVEIGKNTMQGTYIPTNVPMVFTYLNETGTAKRCAFSLEYYF